MPDDNPISRLKLVRDELVAVFGPDVVARHPGVEHAPEVGGKEATTPCRRSGHSWRWS